MCNDNYHGSRCEMYLPDFTSVAFHVILDPKSKYFDEEAVFDFEQFMTDIAFLLHIHRHRVQTHGYTVTESGDFDLPFEILGPEYSNVYETMSSFTAGQRLLQAQNAGALDSWGIKDLDSRFDPPNLALIVSVIVLLCVFGSCVLGVMLKRCYDHKRGKENAQAGAQIIEVTDEQGNKLYKDVQTGLISYDKPHA